MVFNYRLWFFPSMAVRSRKPSQSFHAARPKGHKLHLVLRVRSIIAQAPQITLEELGALGDQLESLSSNASSMAALGLKKTRRYAISVD
jgi:hypothetical protein